MGQLRHRKEGDPGSCDPPPRAPHTLSCPQPYRHPMGPAEAPHSPREAQIPRGKQGSWQSQAHMHGYATRRSGAVTQKGTAIAGRHRAVYRGLEGMQRSASQERRTLQFTDQTYSSQTHTGAHGPPVPQMTSKPSDTGPLGIQPLRNIALGLTILWTHPPPRTHPSDSHPLDT